jgi:hypothetical protein
MKWSFILKLSNQKYNISIVDEWSLRLKPWGSNLDINQKDSKRCYSKREEKDSQKANKEEKHLDFK